MDSPASVLAAEPLGAAAAAVADGAGAGALLSPALLVACSIGALVVVSLYVEALWRTVRVAPARGPQRQRPPGGGLRGLGQLQVLCIVLELPKLLFRMPFLLIALRLKLPSFAGMAASDNAGATCRTMTR
jgi:hypothetical protein